MARTWTIALAACAALTLTARADAQEARRRWEMQRQIRLDKFEQVLPVAMKNTGIDLWIVAVKENHIDPLWEDMGRGYVSGVGYYVFSLKGDRVERFALGVATAEIGALTETERRAILAVAHAFSGLLLDLRSENDDLAAKLIELQRLMGG